MEPRYIMIIQLAKRELLWSSHVYSWTTVEPSSSDTAVTTWIDPLFVAFDTDYSLIGFEGYCHIKLLQMDAVMYVFQIF